MQVEINFISLIVAGVAAMAAGFVWYSPMVMGKQWMKLMGYTPKDLKEAQKKMGPMYGVSFVATLVMVFVLSHVTTMSQNFFEITRLQAGIQSAFWMWLGFVAPVQLTDVIFGQKDIKLFGINTGYQLVALLIAGSIIGFLG